MPNGSVAFQKKLNRNILFSGLLFFKVEFLNSLDAIIFFKCSFPIRVIAYRGLYYIVQNMQFAYIIFVWGGRVAAAGFCPKKSQLELWKIQGNVLPYDKIGENVYFLYEEKLNKVA